MDKKEKKSQKTIESFFNNIFTVNKTEKQKVLGMVEKHNVNFFLFYTDYRNIPKILKYGIQQLKDLKLKEGKVYYVWSYLQHDESIDLEFDDSSRAYFWKWAADSDMDPNNMCIIGIDPYKLSSQTLEDWVFDSSLNLVTLHETVPPSSIDWVMVRNQSVMNKLGDIINKSNLDIQLYLGKDSEVKSKKKNGESKNG